MGAPERFERGENDEGQGGQSLEEFREHVLEKYEQEQVMEPRQEGQEKVAQDEVETLELEPKVVTSDATQSSKLEEGHSAEAVSTVTKTLDESESKIEPVDASATKQADAEVLREEGTQKDMDMQAEARGKLAEEVDERPSVGGYFPYENQVAVTEQEAPSGPPLDEVRVQTEDLHRIPDDCEVEAEPEADEARTLEVVDYGKGATVRVPKTDLERLGFDPDEAGEKSIVELQLKDYESEDEELKTVFARYVSSDRRAEVYVGGIGGEKGDEYEPVRAREYTEERFVRDFDRNKCEHLQNVRLEGEEDRLFVEVDGRKVELEGHRLSTSGHQVMLSGKLGGEADFKVEFDGRKETVRFGRGYPVEGMKMEGDELVVSYAQSRNEKHNHRIYLEHQEAPERPSLKEFGLPEMLEHVKAFDHPDRVEGTYQFILDKAVQKEAGTLLDEAWKRGGDNERDMLKGDVGEVLVPNLLELVGWERIKRHPFNDTRKEGVGANGTDWLLRAPDEKLVMVEVKWWGDSTRAELKGGLQVGKEYDVRRPYQGEEILGAYVATMDWSVDDNAVKVFVKRIRPEANLR